MIQYDSSFAKWACWTSHTSDFFHRSWFKDKGPTSLWAKVSPTCHCQESRPTVVCLDKTLEEAEIEDGECLGALVLQPQAAATVSAFAVRCQGNSTTVTWGDSSEVRDELRGVQQIQVTNGAFAAILEDGSVVSWGNASFGGDSSAVRDQIRGLQQIQAARNADLGGDDSAVRYHLRMVQQVPATNGAFAAILEDGSVVSWGNSDFGGDSSASRDELKGVQQIGPQFMLLLPFRKMDPSWPGVVQTLAGTVLQFLVSSRVCSRYTGHPFVWEINSQVSMQPEVAGCAALLSKWVACSLGK